MARLQDVPLILHDIGLREFTRRVVREIRDDSLLIWACALSYSWLFAIFPFMIFLLGAAPHLPLNLQTYATDAIHLSLKAALPPVAEQPVRESVDHAMRQSEHRAFLSAGLLVTIWAASSGMYMTMLALDRCYDLPRGRPFYILRLWAIGLTLIVATLIVAVLALAPLGTVATRWAVANYPGAVSHGMLLAWNGARYTLALLLMMLILALIYYFGPSIRQNFHAVTPGAVFCVTVWIVLAFIFRIYVMRFGRYDVTYGSLGGAAILLLFFYLDALVLLIGAEINSEIDFARGIPRGSTDFRTLRPLFSDADETSDAEPADGIVLAIARPNGTDRPAARVG